MAVSCEHLPAFLVKKSLRAICIRKNVSEEHCFIIFRSSGMTKSTLTYSDDEWEIPFESITNLEWLGSGSQGAVFMGKLNGKVVAVKKVKDKEETNIKHLQHLNHQNVIKFQ